MRSQNTRAAGASQARSDSPGLRADAAGRTRLKFAWLAQLKMLLCRGAGHNACKGQKVSHRLVADLAEEIASGRYPSFMKDGEVWVGQASLANRLGVNERQVRRAIAVLVALKLLRVERASRGRRRDTNKMAALLHEKPLFEADRTHYRASASGENRTSASSDHRARAPSNSKKEEAKKDSSPVSSCKVGPAAQIGPQVEGELFDCDEIQDEPNAASRVVEISFARLLRDYPHPPSSQEHRAYRPHARTAWSKLTPAQKASAVRAATNAPGKEWLGHWLDSGRETGKFEVVEQCAVVARMWVRHGTPQWAAWVKHYGANGRQPPTTQHRVNGELQTGWMFESEWPPGFEHVDVDGGS
jgi:hypothetical protein